MQLLRGLSSFQSLSNGCVAAIGNFDGVHRGHQALISTLIEKARAAKLPSLVILFEPQPAEYFNPHKPPARLTSFREKVLHLKDLGVDCVYCFRFNSKLAMLDPQAFIEQLLCIQLNINELIVGQDFCFGKNRTGNVQLLASYFNQSKRKVHVFPDFQLKGERISSTHIRQALFHSNLSLAREMLGRDFSVCRRVIRGEGRGSQWGIPTANFAMPQHSLPLKGVYCVQALRHGVEILNGVANIGCRPTVDGLKNNLEVHFLNWTGSLYGDSIEVKFLKKIRDEEKFSSMDALINQIRDDIKKAKGFFETCLSSCESIEKKILLNQPHLES